VPQITYSPTNVEIRTAPASVRGRWYSGQIHRTLKLFPTVSTWLTFNFDYFLIGTKIKILNTFLSLAANDLPMFPVQ
jgi:hypothetical protein